MTEQSSENNTEEGKRAKKRRRFPNWSMMETNLFIELCKEHKVLEKIDGKKFRWADVLAPVASDMAASEFGFERDTDQLLCKFKNLQKQYREAVSHNSTSGNSPSTFVYYKEMNELCGARPRNIFPIDFGVERNYQSDNQSRKF